MGEFDPGPPQSFHDLFDTCPTTRRSATNSARLARLSTAAGSTDIGLRVPCVASTRERPNGSPGARSSVTRANASRASSGSG